MTLNDFENMCYYRDFPIAVVPWRDFDDAVDAGLKMTDYLANGAHEVLFAIAACDPCGGYQLKAYLKDKYANATVKGFMFMDAWCVIGVDVEEE